MNGTDEPIVGATAPVVVDVQSTTDIKKSLSLLIILNQTYSKEQKQLVLYKLNSSLNQINEASLSSSYLVNLKEEINYVIQAYQQESYNFDQEYCVSSKNDNFQFELLINGTLISFKKALRSFLQSPSQIKNFIYAGIDYNSNANLVLQDSLLSFDDLNLLFNDYSSTLGDSLKTINFNFNFNSKYIHENQQWKHLDKLFKNLKFLQPTISTVAGANANDELNELTNFVSNYLNEKLITDLMEETKLTGTLNVEKPALYIFPSREGDCSFFTFNGYSMLINGGYDRVNPSFWRFASMLKQIDSVMFTHQDSDALGGLSSFFSKKLVQPNVKPNILSVFGNLNKLKNHADYDVDVITEAMDELKIKLQPLVKHDLNNLKPHHQPEHINLYFKHGYGSLDMHVLSPFANSAEYKEFLNQTQAKVQSNIHKSHLSVNQTFKNIPVSHLSSAVVLLAWTPCKVGENAVRILFTGNAPQHVIVHALEKVKEFDLLQSPVFKIKGESVAVPVKKSNANVKATSGDKAQNGVEKKPVVAKLTDKMDHGKGDAKGLNTSVSVEKKTVANGTSKPTASTSVSASASASASATSASSSATKKPPSAPKPAANGIKNKKETPVQATASASASATSTETKKTEVSKKPAAAAAAVLPKDEHKEEQKEVKKPVAAPRPPVAKKEETKPKAEKVESTRVSVAPVASKSEHNTKATASSLSSAPVKPRPSTSKPNVKPEKEKEDKPEVHKKPAAAAPVPKPAQKSVVDNKAKPPVGKDSKSSKPVAKSTEQAKEAKKEEKPVEEVKPVAAADSEVIQQSVISESVQAPPVQLDSIEPVISSEQVESQENQESIKIDIDSLLIPDAHLTLKELNGDNAENGNNFSRGEQDQEDVRKEVAAENKFEFYASECAPLDAPNDECELEKEEYSNQNLEDEIEPNNDSIHEQDVDEEQNHIPADESPNLSPVKPSLSKDSVTSADEQQEQEEPELVETPQENLLQEVEVEDKTNRRVNLELNLDDVQQCVVVNSPEELINTPKHSADSTPVEETAELPTDDIMTRSFIDNGENQSNPFAPKEPEVEQEQVDAELEVEQEQVETEPEVEQQQIEAKQEHVQKQDQQLDEELSNESQQSFKDDSGAIVSEQVNEQQQSEYDTLINGFKSINIQPENGDLHNGQNGHHNGHTNGHANGHANGHENGHDNSGENGHDNGGEKPSKSDYLLDFGGKQETDEYEIVPKLEKQTPTQSQPSDPSTWSLLELPKPVNEVVVKELGVNVENKEPITPSSEQHPPLSTSSPTQVNKKVIEHTSESKKAGLNTSINKPSTSSNTKSSGSNQVKSPVVHPLYFEVSYIPAHGNPYYVDSEFFKRVRARFYVLSSIDPSQNVLNALLDAKQTWEDKELQVSIIPTYESDTLRHWFLLNAEQLAKYKIDVLPAANLTTLTIDNNADFAYQVHKLEF